MRNLVFLLGFWNIYCCFPAGSLTTLRPQGSLRGNVHFFLFFFFPPLFCAGPSLSCRPLRQCFYVPTKSFPTALSVFSSWVSGGHLFRMRASASKPSWRLRGEQSAWAGVLSFAPFPFHSSALLG